MTTDKVYRDSTGQVITVGDSVKFRGQEYTIAEFLSTTGACDTSQIRFEEKQHTQEIADEISVDFLRNGER